MKTASQPDPTRSTTSLAIEAHDADPMTTELFSPETTRFASTVFQDVIGIWRSRKGDADLPEWYAFDFADFKGWHGHLVVSWFPDDQPNPQVRIMGESWRAIYGGSITGLRFSEMKPNQYEQQFRDHFGEIRRTGQIGFTSGRSTLLDRDYLIMNVLELPVRRNGSGVGGLIHCLKLGDLS